MKKDRIKSNILKLILVVAIIVSQSNLVSLVAYAESGEWIIDSEMQVENEENVMFFDNEADVELEKETDVDFEEETEVGSEDENDVDSEEETEVDSENESSVDLGEETGIDSEEGIIAPFSSSSTRTIGSGLVQFELKPISWPSGVTETEARHALMNVTSETHPLLAVSGGATHSTSINGAFGRDALYLGETATHYHVYISGYEGLVAKEGATGSVTLSINGTSRTIQYQVVAVYYPFGTFAAGQNRSATPIPVQINLLEDAEDTVPFVEADGVQTFSAERQVSSASYYVNRGGTLYRVLTGNVENSYTSITPWGHVVGAAPSWMAANTAYYSYDGVYFYKDPRDIVPSGNGAVNEGAPHYNYFQYLSFRSQTNYTATDLNKYILSQLTTSEQSTSKLVGTGEYFTNAQNAYGTNATLQFAFAIHESGRGLSNIALNNNNLFGINAIDSNPAGSANAFETIQAGIYEHADRWISKGYLNPSDWRYAGPHLGNKGSGMNTRYATDPYWGEKIAGWAYQIDRALKGSDLYNYTIGVLESTATVSVTNSTGTKLYTAGGFRNFPFLITGSDGNRRRIQTDVSVVGNSVDSTATYDRTTSLGFIPDSNLKIVGGTNGPTPVPTPPDVILPDNGNDTNGGNGSDNEDETPSGGSREGETTERVNFRTGPGTNYGVIKTLPVGQSLTILSESNGWMKVRVGTQEGWVSAQYVKVIDGNNPDNGNSGSTNDETRQGQTTANLNLRTGAGTNHSIIKTLPNGTSLTILSESNGWMKVRVGTQEGWVSAEYVKVTEGNSNSDNSSSTRQGQTTANLNLRTGAGTNHSIIKTLPNGTSLTILSESNGWMKVRIGAQEGWVSAEYVKVTDGNSSNDNSSSTRQGQTTANLNLRTGAGTNHSIIKTLPNGTSLTILSESNGWMKVRVGTQEGWVSAEYVKETTGNNNSSGSDSSSSATSTGVTTARLNLRTGAGTNHSIIKTLPLGQSLTILSESNGWMRVRVGTQEGWVSAEYVNKNSSNSTRTVVTTARLNFRTGAGLNYSIIKTLPLGQSLTALSESNGWMKVRVGTQEGWVSAEYVK